MNTGLPSTVPGMSALIRFGSVYMFRTFLLTVASSSDRKIVLPRLLLIFPCPSVPTRMGTSAIRKSGSGKTSP